MHSGAATGGQRALCPYFARAFCVSCVKLVGSKITSCESILRFNPTPSVFKACINTLYVIPAAREPALIRRIHKRRKSRFFLRRSLYEDESAFKLRCCAVRKRVECDPRNPRFRSKILLRRFLATFPRFTRVISDSLRVNSSFSLDEDVRLSV